MEVSREPMEETEGATQKGPTEDEDRRKEREDRERNPAAPTGGCDPDEKIDEASQESFPASDPPSWTPTET